MKNQEKIYLPLLEKFCSEIVQNKNLNDIPEVFVPIAMPNYIDAEKKIFYCGSDTFGWGEMSNLMEFFKDNDLKNYLTENNKWLTPEGIIKHSNNNPASFWGLVIRLHLMIKTKQLKSLSNLTDEDINHLNDIGYGNIYSIEHQKILKKRGVWENIDKYVYDDIKSKSCMFDHLKLILNCFNPDIVFIFTWDESKEEDIFLDLKPEWNEVDFKKGIISTYTIEGYKTKLIWCLHPNRLRFKSMNADELINEILRVL